MKKAISAILALMLAWAIALPAGALDEKFNMSYIYFGSPSDYSKLVDRTQDSVNEVAPAYFSLTKQGELVLTPAVSTEFVSKMHEKGILVVPYITNDWVQETGIAAMNNKHKLTDDLAAAVRKYDLDGINVDIENLTEKQRDDYVEFVRLLREKLPKGKRIVVAVAANPWGSTTGWAGSYDYAALAKYCDYLMIMAYDESYQGSKPGPVASISFVERSIQYALKHVSRDKLVLGLPFYGRIWSTSGSAMNGYGISNSTVESLIANYRGYVTFDNASKSARATITVKSGDKKPVIGGKALPAGTYVIWYSNEQAIKAALDLVRKYDLMGTGSWSLGQETARTWDYYKLWLNGATFADVQYSWAKKEILAAYMNGWMTGISADKFSPGTSLTRAEATTVIVRMTGLPAEKGSLFDDAIGHWAEAYIDTAKRYGLVSGTGDNSFEPDRPITRAEMAVLLNNILGYSAGSKTFRDVTKDRYPWAYDAISALHMQGIITGYTDNSFKPQNYITRAEMAALITRLDTSLMSAYAFSVQIE